MIRVTVAGATGWVGRPLIEAIEETDDLRLVAAVSRSAKGQPTGGVTISGSIDEALRVAADVFVDYTSATAVKGHVLAAIQRGLHVVIGSSGLTGGDFDEIDAAAKKVGIGVIAVGNFAIAAALMQKFAIEAAKHFPAWEIIDSAYAGKPDAPSGMARELASRLAEAGKPDVTGSRVHSLRLPGYTIGLEARFGLEDQRLTISYDGGTGAAPYIAGTLLAIRRAHEFNGLVRGMDRIL